MDNLNNNSNKKIDNSDIGWNFVKFLVDKNGKVIDRYTSMATPESIEDDVKELLEK